MADCPNVRMRDDLPDLLHGSLSPEREAAVRAHVDQCDACRSELALLARVRDSLPMPTLATDRIASRIPRYHSGSFGLRSAGGRVLRIAAAIVVLVGGASLVLLNDGRAPDVPVVEAERGGVPTELAVGETFADVSDSALVELVEALADLEPQFSEDPEAIALPLLPAEGS